MFERLTIPDVFLFAPKRFGDSRGHFTETYNRAVLEPMTGPLEWVQDNVSLSAPRGVVRGLHFQIPPFAQDKLVRCVRGAIRDVVLDIRKGSPTYGRHVSVVISAHNGAQLFVPKGFAHGFATLEPDVEIAYKVSNYYSPACDRGVLWNDETLGIDWGIDASEATLSEKDLLLPRFSDLADYFQYPC